MRIRNHIHVSVIVALLYWVADSLIHWFVYGGGVFEVIPSDINELWMRTLIFILLICFGIQANYFTRKNVAVEEEKRQIYKTTVSESKHILNDFVKEVRHFQNEVVRGSRLDNDTFKYLDDAIRKTEIKLDDLNNVGEITKENIQLAVNNPNKIVIADEILKCATDCTKGHVCQTDDEYQLCPVERCIEGKIHFIKCLDTNDCYYKNAIADLTWTCTCPVRKEIFNKYGI